MNERYLFRGKTGIGEQWIVGDLMQWDDGARQISVNDDDGAKSKYTVIPETVGQCTGLKDKNGKMIFEGDAVKFKKFENEYIGKIVFNDISLAFEIRSKVVVGAYSEKAIFSHLLCHCDAIEVIGNKWDNPELLEVD